MTYPTQLPPRPSLEYQRKLARRLLAAVRAADPDALAHWRAHHPAPDRDDPKLADAQLVVARGYGLASWPRLVQAIRAARQTRDERAAALVTAACTGDVPTARQLLAAEPDLATHDAWTALACGEPGPLPDDLDAAGGPLDWPPLLYATHSRLIRAEPARAAGFAANVGRLLDAGADPDAHVRDAEHGVQTALYGAAGIANHAGMTRALLDAGADPDELEGPAGPDPRTSVHGTEALYHACEWPDPTCLRLLVDAGPDPRRVTYCLGRALDFDRVAPAQVLLDAGAEPDLEIPWAGRMTHLQKAARMGRDVALIRQMAARSRAIDATDDHGDTALRLAIRYGHAAQAQALIDAGADASRVTDDDRAHGALLTGASASSPPTERDDELLGRAAARGDSAAIARLLDAGFDANAPLDMPALHQAAWRGHLGATRALLEAGADPRALNSYGGDALGAALHGSMHCVDREGGIGMMTPYDPDRDPRDYPEVVALLLDAGCPAPTRVAGSPDVADLLRARGVLDDD